MQILSNYNKKFITKIKIFVYSSFFLIFTSLILIVDEAKAHCPLCVAGAGAGLSLSRLIGIDDSVTGIWMAALLGAMSYWFTNSLKRKYIPFQEGFVYIIIFVTTIFSFFRFGLVNEHNGLIMNTPKLIFGMILGGVLFYLATVGNRLAKKKRGGVMFPYQSIIVSLGVMVIASLALLVAVNYYI